MGNYKESLDQYQKLHDDTSNNDVALNLGVCMFYLGMYEEAQKIVEDLPESPLKIRLLFHLAHKLGDDDRLMELHGSLRDVIEDQLSLAGLHYLRGQYQEAIDIYKRILLDNKNLHAVNVYVALCYYKLDYFGMSQEVLDLYLANHSDSIIAANLKACNRFRMFNGQAAEQDIKHLIDSGIFGIDLIKHNLVVFRNGEGSLQILPQLIDIVPEARLNLAIHHLRRNETQEAHQLIKDMQPKVPHEYILKGVVHACMYQESNSVWKFICVVFKKLLKIFRSLFRRNTLSKLNNTFTLLVLQPQSATPSQVVKRWRHHSFSTDNLRKFWSI